MESYLILDLNESPEFERAFFGFSDMLRLKKNAFSDLLESYQPLLAELSIAEVPTVKNGGAGAGTSKDNLKQLFMESALGGRVTDKLKLSDFIDEEFFNELDSDSDMPL